MNHPRFRAPFPFHFAASQWLQLHGTVAWLKKSHPDSFPSPAMALSRGYRQPGNRWMWMSSPPPGNMTAKKKKPLTNNPFWGGSMLVDGRVEIQMAGVFGDFPQPIFTLKATCQNLGVVLNFFLFCDLRKDPKNWTIRHSIAGGRGKFLLFKTDLLLVLDSGIQSSEFVYNFFCPSLSWTTS